MKPITEQEWRVAQLDARVIENAEGLVVADIRARLSEDGRETAALIAAAPDMARALALAEELVNAIQQGHRVDEEFLERAHAAINGARRKAGVLP